MSGDDRSATFPDGFVWGVSACAYQIEGAASQGGRGPSVWDAFCHAPGHVWHGHTGDVACDHYHRWRDDVELMGTLGVNAYRMSISWPRVLPAGTGSVNEEGMAFYDRLVDGLLARGIEPWVVLFHWDYPLALFRRGGWLHPDSPRWFADYTAVVVDRLSDRVTHWLTMVEPACFVMLGHRTGEHAPGLFPASGEVYLHARNAATGKGIWRRSILLPPQGHILPVDDVLLLPNGRASPAEYHIASGKPVAAFSDLRREGGGAYAARLDDMLVYGPNEYGILRFGVSREAPSGGTSRRPRGRAIRGSLTGLAGRRAVAVGDTSLLLRDDALLALPSSAFGEILASSAAEYPARRRRRIIASKSGVQQSTDRQAEKALARAVSWRVPIEGGRSCIVAGRYAVVGGPGLVTAVDLSDGTKVAECNVDGTVWELAAADGVLLASTDAGKVYAFGAQAVGGESPTQRRADRRQGRDGGRSAQAARFALAQAARSKGFCVVLGLEDGSLARQIAEQSKMRVLCLETDGSRARRVREALLDSGHLGRVRVHHLPDGNLPYVSYLANLVVSESLLLRGEMPFNPVEAYRLVQPYGGVMVLAGGRSSLEEDWPDRLPDWREMRCPGAASWRVLRRGPLDQAGQWTHQFADPANTACSGDRLVAGRSFRLQWFGDPAGRQEVGWHANGMGPLYRDGVLFAIKVDHVDAIDAYNGTSLWSRTLPGSARFSPGREGAAACVDASCLYVAVKNDCEALDVTTGRTLRRFDVPGGRGDWGFIAVADGLLYGTRQKPQATLARPDRLSLKAMWNASEAEWACSDLLFALSAEDAERTWAYGGDGGRLIINSTITLSDGRVYLIESRDKADLDDADGSLLLRDALDRDVWLVALASRAGRTLWQRPVQLQARTMLYLSSGNRKLVISEAWHTGPLADAPPTTDAGSLVARKLGTPDARDRVRSTRIHFAFRALDANDGEEAWRCAYTSEASFADQHNYNVSHPVLLEETLWHAPAQQSLARVDLATGRLVRFPKIRRAKGCATPTASARNLFYRSLGTASFDTVSGEQFYVSRVSRPSCWLSILPAGGLVLMPEYSIGCNCAFPMQTSIVLMPQRSRPEPP